MDAENTRPPAVDVVDEIMLEFDAMIEEQRAEDVEAAEALGILRGIFSMSSATAAESPSNDDELLSIAAAAALPELGGIVGKKRLYEEVAAGRLKLAANSGPGKFFVTRKNIKEWIEWHVDGSPRISSGSQTKSTKPRESSGRVGTGPSPTERPDLAQASALNLVNRLRKPASTTK